MNQYSGSNFEGTPISQLVGNNEYNNFGTMPPISPPQNNFFQQPSRDIRNMVNNINHQIENDYNTIRDNITFDLSSIESKKPYLKKKDESSVSSEKKHKKKHKKTKKIDDTTEEETDDSSDYITLYNFGKHLNNDTKELLLIIAIYSILSLGFVKKTVGGYITYINPTETGKYSFIGILIYGFLLAILFIALKKMIIK